MPSTKKHYPKKKPNFTVKRFKKLVNKPDISKKGITYSIEKSENIDEIKAKQRESRIKYYNKKKLLKQQEQHDEAKSVKLN